MAPSPRQIVRTTVGLAAVLPAVGLGVLAVSLVLSGGFGGVMAGLVIGALAVGLLVVALLWTHAPVTIARFLKDTEAKREDKGLEPGGSNGQPPVEDLSSQDQTDGHR